MWREEMFNSKFKENISNICAQEVKYEQIHTDPSQLKRENGFHVNITETCEKPQDRPVNWAPVTLLFTLDTLYHHLDPMTQTMNQVHLSVAANALVCGPSSTPQFWHELMLTHGRNMRPFWC